jgi:hypothetical protein
LLITRPLLAISCLCLFAHAQTPPPGQVYAIDPKVVRAPIPIAAPESAMPDQARRKQVPGLCAVDIIVDRKGLPQNPHVIRCTDPIFAENSLNAVKRYRFKPATTLLDNKPVPVRMHVEINYRWGFNHDPTPLPRPHIRLGFLISSQPIAAEPDAAGVYTLSHAFDPPNSLPHMQRFVGMSFGRAAFILEDGVGCTADITIDATGHPTDAQITKCDNRDLEKSALQSLLASDFAPAILNRKPVPVRASVHLVCEGFDQPTADSH